MKFIKVNNEGKTLILNLACISSIEECSGETVIVDTDGNVFKVDESFGSLEKRMRCEGLILRTVE